MDPKKKSAECVKKFQDFIGFEPKILKYLHNTSTKDIAEKIMQEGFEFEKYLENTTDLISGVDTVELQYFKYVRNSYGQYTMVIQIAKKLGDHYSSLLQDTEFHFTEVLSFKETKESSDNEPIYTLPPQYVKGYFYQKTSKAVFNPIFDPFFDSPVFKKNVKRLLSSRSDRTL